MVLFGGFAYAVPWTWTDIYDDDFYFSQTGNQTLTFLHDINDDHFDVGKDLVWSYNLVIGLDDDPNSDAQGRVFINLPGFITDGSFKIIDYVDIERGFSLAGLIQLNTSGTLTVNLTRISGDFYFDESTLNASGWESKPNTTTNPSAVPEPTTLLLLGSGLVGFGILGRKRFRRKD
jgi:hypothetical protein